MKILFISLTDPKDKKALSGTMFSMYECLKKEHQIEWIGAFKFSLFQNASFLFRKVCAKVFGYTFPQFNSKFLSEKYALAVNSKLLTIKYDVVFAPMASSLIAEINGLKNIIYLTDATFKPMLGYYLHNVPEHYKKQGNSNENKALQKSSKIIFCSNWAKDTTLKAYDVDCEKAEVVELGPNLETIPSKDSLKYHADLNATIKLTFVGVDWKRKGGDIVYQCFKKLKEWGFSCQLTIVGCVPPIEKDIDIIVYPFLDKNLKEDSEKLFSIYYDTHFLIVPSRAECYGLVFCEASAFGVPSLATDTGGIPSIIRSDLNGYLFPLSADGEIYANKVKEVWLNQDKYAQLRTSTRKEFEERLNWDNWTIKVNKIISEIAK